MESCLIDKAKCFNGDSLEKIQHLNKHLDGIDRTLSPVEEFQRYEAIFDHYLTEKVDLDSDYNIVITNRNLEGENLDYMWDVLEEAYKIYNNSKNLGIPFEERDRIYAKMITIKVKLLNKKYGGVYN